MQSVINLSCRYTEEEFGAAARLYMLRTPKVAARLATFLGLIALLCCLLLALADVFTPALLLATGSVLCALIYSTLYVVPRKRFRADPRHADDFRWQFADDHIRLTTPHIESKFRWELFTQALVSKRFYVLSFGQGQMIVIPRRAFHTPAQETAFRALLERRLNCALTGQTHDPLPALDAYTPPPTPPDWR